MMRWPEVSERGRHGHHDPHVLEAYCPHWISKTILDPHQQGCSVRSAVVRLKNATIMNEGNKHER